MTREEAHRLVDDIFNQEALGKLQPDVPEEVETAAEPRVLPEGKRVVRTKSSGDRVYLLDEVKKTRSWVTNPDVLQSLGFEVGDVVEVDDGTLLKYQMTSAIYKADGQA